MRVLYADNQLDLDVDIHDVADALGLDFHFYGLGKGLYRAGAWRPMKVVGTTLEVDTDEQQAEALERLVQQHRPDLFWVRSTTIAPEVAHGVADRLGVDVVFWVTEQGGSREAIAPVASGFRKLIVNNPDDLAWYREHTDAELYLLPYCVNDGFYRRTAPDPELEADVVSYGNPVYNDESATAGRTIRIQKRKSVDWMLRPPLGLGMSVKVWGNGGGVSIEKGWLQVPFLNPRRNAWIDGLADALSSDPESRAQRWKRSYFRSRWARPGSLYQGAFAWEQLPVVNSSCRFFANIDHNFEHLRTYSPKLTRAMASGAVVVHMPTRGIEEDFQDMEHLVVVHSEDDAREKLAWLRDRPAAADAIGRAGMELVRERWNYRDTLPALLDRLGHGRPDA